MYLAGPNLNVSSPIELGMESDVAEEIILDSRLQVH